MGNDKISIIIPVYNAEKYLRRCIESILIQTYENIEIIAVNDGSKDDSLKILKEYREKDRRVVIVDKNNEGVSKARNIGIKESTGTYIMFCDSDDWMTKKMVEKLYEKMNSEKVDVVRAEYIRINKEGEEEESYSNGENVKYSKEKFDLITDGIIRGEIPCYTWLLLINKSKIKNIEFKSNIQFREDAIFYLEMLNNIDSIYFMKSKVYYYFQNSESITNNYGIERITQIIQSNQIINDNMKKELNDKKIRLFNSIDLKNIDYTLFCLYSKNKGFNLKDTLILLYNDKEFNRILKSSEISMLSLTQKLPIYALKNKKIRTLRILYVIRKILKI